LRQQRRQLQQHHYHQTSSTTGSAMSATMTTVTIIRESPDSPFGVSYKSVDDKVILTVVKESSPFHSTTIRPGYELISVNGTKLSGMAISDVKAVLTSIQTSEVVIEARPVTDPCKFVFPLEGVARGTTYHKPPVPSLFTVKNVPDRNWERIFQAFSGEVLPELKIYLRMNTVFKTEMLDYTGKQMAKGYVGFGQESHHEKKMFMITNQTATVHGNVVLVASNVLARSNALLNSHGIISELVFENVESLQYSTKQSGSRNYVKLPVGLRFISIDDY
jgi:hypothetical protein